MTDSKIIYIVLGLTVAMTLMSIVASAESMEFIDSTTANNFKVDWYLLRGGLNPIYEIHVRNLLSYKRNFNLSAVISETNFPVQNVQLFEYEKMTRQEWVDTTVCDEIVLGNGSITQECDKSGYYENINYCGWNDAKMGFFNNVGKFTTDYTLINIPKYTNDYEICLDKGIKIFRLQFTGKMSPSPSGWGISGKVAIWDGNLNEYHPWFDENYKNRKNVTLLSYVASDVDIPRNLTIDTQTLVLENRMLGNCNDMIFVNSSGLQIPHYIESGCNSTKTIVWIRQPTKADNSTTIWLYYNNTGASNSEDKNGVMGQYKFAFDMSEGTGATVHDDTATGNDVTLNGGAGWTESGFFGNATAYDGSNDYGVSNSNYANPSIYTLQGWFRLTNQSGANAGMIVLGDLNGGEGRYALLLKGNIRIGMRNATTEYFAVDSSDYLNSWRLVTAIYNSSKGLQLWIDESLIAESNIQNAITYSPDPFYIMSHRTGASTYIVSGGYADNIRITENSLSQDEIIMVYGTATKNLISSWSAQEDVPTQDVTETYLIIDDTQSNKTYGYNPTRVVNATGVSNTTGKGLYVALFVDGVLKANSSDQAEYLEIYGGGIHNITAWTHGNASYYYESFATWFVEIQQADNPLTLQITNATGTYTGYGGTPCGTIGYDIFVTYPGLSTITGTSTSGTGTLWANSTNWSAYNGTERKLGVGYYMLRYNATSNVNYSYNCSQNNLRVLQGDPSLDVTFNATSPATEGTHILINCNHDAEITPKLYNDTHEISLGYVWNTTGLDGIYNFTCNYTGNANYTGDSDAESFTITLEGALVINAVYDETDLSPLIFDVVIYNSTFSTNQEDIANYNNNQVSGALTVTISAEGYGSRRYYITIPGYGSYNLTGYLINNSYGHDVNVNTYNILEQPVDNTLLTFEKLLGAEWVIMAQGKTDDTGKFVFPLDPDTDYRITTYRDGYANKTTTIIPTDTNIIIYLYKTIADIPAFLSYYDGIATSCVFAEANRTRICHYNDTTGHMTGIWLNVSLNTLTNSYQICSDYSTNSSGVLSCVYPVGYQNKTLPWTLYATTSSIPNSIILESGVDLFLTATLGIIGVVLAFLIIAMSGLVGFEMSPTWGVLLTLLSIGISFVTGFMTIEVGMVTAFVGLGISGLLIIIKGEKHGG